MKPRELIRLVKKWKDNTAALIMFNRNNPLEIVILILCSILLISAGLSNKDGNQEKSPFTCDYLGQELPGDIPVKFAPGIISTDDDDS